MYRIYDDPVLVICDRYFTGEYEHFISNVIELNEESVKVRVLSDDKSEKVYEFFKKDNYMIVTEDKVLSIHMNYGDVKEFLMDVENKKGKLSDIFYHEKGYSKEHAYIRYLIRTKTELEKIKYVQDIINNILEIKELDTEDLVNCVMLLESIKKGK